LPFALGIGLQVYVATQVVSGGREALLLGGAGTLFALFFWFGLDWVWRVRDRRPPRRDPSMPEPTSLTNRIKQVLT
jgi:hypothetical protein